MIVGTAGHIDHGKTALVRALTGIDTDRLPAEKARGITIDLGFAYRGVPGAESLGFVDVPGHDGFIHNMLAGTAGIDFALLVVAADDGPMPQTREHLQIIDLLGVRRGIVVLSKCDLVDAGRIAEVSAELSDMLAPTSLAEAEIVPVSVVTGEGLAALEARLFEAAQTLLPHPRSGYFRLAVDRSFSLSGIGTVVTGTAFSGVVRVGDKLIVSPQGLAVRVRAIHAQNGAAALGHAGQRCALNLVGNGVNKDRIRRGDWIVEDPLHRPTDRLDARVRLLASEKHYLRHGSPIHLHLGAARIPARLALLDREQLRPGEEAVGRIVLDHPVLALHGDRFVFRDHSARRTMGGGMVLDPWPPRRGQRRPERLRALASLADPEPRNALLGVLSGDPGWIDLTSFALARNLSAEMAAALMRNDEIVCVEAAGAAFGFSPDKWRALIWEVQTALARYHEHKPDSPGLEPRRLCVTLDLRLPTDVFSASIAAMVRDGSVARDGPWLKLSGHSVHLGATDQRLWERIRPGIERDRFQPPRVRDFARALDVHENEVRRVLLRLASMGTLVEVAHDRFYKRATVADMAAAARLLAAQAGDAAITAAAFRDRIGTGRKLAIEILEFFDRTGITIRQGDLRRTRENRVEISE